MSEPFPRRRKKDAGGGQGWILTYGDMVTLLMAFFVMLFAMSEVKQDSFEAFLRGLAPFDNPNADTTPDLVAIGEPAAPLPAIVPGGRPGQEGSGSAAEDARALGAQVRDATAAAGVPGSVQLQIEPKGLSLVIETDDVLFASGSSEVTPRGRQILAALAPVLAARAEDVDVEGHTDDVPLDRGGYTNWNLSTDRAVAVVDLLAGAGVPPQRLSARGFGEHDPRDAGGTAEARARNRRVEIVLVAAGG